MSFMEFPHFAWIRQKHGFVDDSRFWLVDTLKSLLLWNRLVIWINILTRASVEGLLWGFFILSLSETKCGLHTGFFLLIDTLKIFSPETTWPNGLIFGMKHLWRTLCRILWIVSHFVFWVLLQLPLWYGFRFIIEGRNGTCRCLNLTVVCWMSHLLFLYLLYSKVVCEWNTRNRSNNICNDNRSYTVFKILF